MGVGSCTLRMLKDFLLLLAGMRIMHGLISPSARKCDLGCDSDAWNFCLSTFRPTFPILCKVRIVRLLSAQVHPLPVSFRISDRFLLR